MMSQGMEIVREIEGQPTAADRPLKECVITDCGALLPGQDDGIFKHQNELVLSSHCIGANIQHLLSDI